MYVAQQGFAPDADISSEGVWTDCDLLIPTLRGFESLPGDTYAGAATVSGSAVMSAKAFTHLDGSVRLLAGTGDSASSGSANLYEVTVSSLTSRNGAGAPYTASAAARWTFAQYNDIVLASQKGTQMLQSASPSSDFTAISGAPQAVAVVTALDFAVAFNTTDALFGDSPNRWWCCAAGDVTDWVPDVATQATSGLLTQSLGEVIAASVVGDDIVAFSPNVALLGQYVGTPEVWRWTVVAGEGLGAHSSHSVVDVEGVGLLWPGKDNFYLFDGSRATPIGTNRVAQSFLTDLDTAFAKLIVGFHERNKSRVFWWYPSLGGGLGNGTLDRFLCYNYRVSTWGFGRKTVAFPLSASAVGLTFDDLGAAYATWDALPALSYDTAFAPAGMPVPSFFDTSGALVNMNGTSSTSYFTTGGIGADGVVSALSRVRPRFQKVPTSGVLEHAYANILGETWRVSGSTTMQRGVFDHVFASRWHRLKHTFTGTVELGGIDVEIRAESTE